MDITGSYGAGLGVRFENPVGHLLAASEDPALGRYDPQPLDPEMSIMAHVGFGGDF